MTTTMTMKKRVVLAAWLLAALAVPVYATESSSDDAPLPGQELAPKTPPGEDDAEFYAGSAEDPVTQLSQSKECKKLVKGFKAKKMTPEKMLKQLKSFEGPGDSSQATKAVNLLECSGWDDQCQAAVTSIVGATCVYEVGAILTWAAANNKFANGTFVFNADTDTSQIKESLGECCDGKLTAACCTSLSTMSAEYGRVGWSGGCFCEEEALEIVFGPTQKTTVKSIYDMVGALGCDAMTRSPNGDLQVYPEGLSIYPEC